MFCQSWINQTSEDWSLHCIHDGQNDEFDSVMKTFQNQHSGIKYSSTMIRYNDYGHSLREIGLAQPYNSEYTLLTNCDNYFVPEAVDIMISTRDNNKRRGVGPDVIIFDIVHSHTNPGNRTQPKYNLFEVEFSRDNIDVSAAIVKTEIAKTIGFPDKGFAGDQTYFANIRKAYPSSRVAKANHILVVHN